MIIEEWGQMGYEIGQLSNGSCQLSEVSITYFQTSLLSVQYCLTAVPVGSVFCSLKCKELPAG